MREMRRNKLAMGKSETLALLNEAEYGVLSTVSKNGRPYGIPLNYCVIDKAIYFHCAIEGKKIEHIQGNRFVSFCVVGKTKILPRKFSTKYESVIVAGEAEEVFHSEKQAGLEGLIGKYSSKHTAQGLKYIKALDEETKVFKITINNIAGKARKK